MAASRPTASTGGSSCKDGIKWHDGTPFTAEDVKYTIELINNPDFRAGRRAGHELVRDIQVVCADRADLAAGEAVRALSGDPVLDLHRAQAHPGQGGRSQHVAVQHRPGRHRLRSSGSSACPATTSRSRPIEDYFGEGPYLERLIFKYIPDMTVLYTQFQTGDVDYTGIQGISRRPLRGGQGAGRPGRHAGAAAVRREHRLQSRAAGVPGQGGARGALPGHGQAGHDRRHLLRPADADRILPAQGELGLQSRPAEAHSYDPEKAKQILEEAGWKLGSDGVREKNGVRLEFTNSTTAGNQLREQAQQLLQQTWGRSASR